MPAQVFEIYIFKIIIYGGHTLSGMSRRVEVSSRPKATINIIGLNALPAPRRRSNLATLPLNQIQLQYLQIDPQLSQHQQFPTENPTPAPIFFPPIIVSPEILQNRIQHSSQSQGHLYDNRHQVQLWLILVLSHLLHHQLQNLLTHLPTTISSSVPTLQSPSLSSLAMNLQLLQNPKQ